MAANGWRETTVGALCDEGILHTQTGPFGSQLHSYDYVPSGVPVVPTEGIGRRRLLTDGIPEIGKETAARLSRHRLKSGDILFARRGVQATGLSAIVTPKQEGWICGTGAILLRVLGDSIQPEFLSFLLSSDESILWLKQHAVGAVMPNLNEGVIRQLPLKLPSLAEQKAIAAVLGALDDKIELNRQMNATLEAVARALFHSWFVDFDPVRAKLDRRQPIGMHDSTAALFTQHLEESNLGKKPVGWEVTTLGTTLSVLEVGGRPKGGVGGINSGIPSIGAESIVGIGQFDFGKTKYITAEFYESMRKGRIQSHDVLLYKDGGRPGEYEPHVSMFGDGFPFEKCSVNEHVYRLRTNERLSQEYLYFWLTSDAVVAEMRVKGTGVAIPGINSTSVRSLTMLVPPRPIVEAFTKQAAPLIARIFANAKHSRKLSALRDTLLPKMLSGEITVNPHLSNIAI